MLAPLVGSARIVSAGSTIARAESPEVGDDSHRSAVDDERMRRCPVRQPY